MLINCPECELQVSDKAITCPHCGYPLKEPTKQRTRKSAKRRRLPNGFGQISEIKNRNLRKPFRAMVTVGKDSAGRPICKPLKPEAFFETYNDAYIALVEYHKNPYDLEPDVTVKDLYERWSEQYFPTLKNNSSIRTITSAWAYCSSIQNMRVKDIRARHLKGVIEDGTANINGEIRTPSPSTKGRIKSMFNLMFDYALEYELTDRNYARTFEISADVIKEREASKRSHMPFSDEEMNKLWSNAEKIKYADLVLFQCYSGMRPQELGLIKISDVHLEDGYLIGGMKTDAGTNRVIPIHPHVAGIVRKYQSEANEINSEYLFNCTDTHTHRSNYFMTYDKYAKRFKKICELLELSPEHRAHDPRKHFVTIAKKYKVDEYAIKYIIGHKISDLTESTYTEREISWLISEAKKIK